VEHKDILCPSCGSELVDFVMDVTDHFLSKEQFKLYHCSSCDLVFTWPRPEEARIGDYYKSEDYVSHSSTKKGLVNRAYNFVRSYTLKRKLKLVKALTDGRDLLDIGAGTGHFLKVMSDNGFNALGLEPDEDARNVASRESGIVLRRIQELHELGDSSFDVVTMWHVLEHVYNLRKDLQQITALIRKDGVLIIAVPNHTSKDAGKYGSNWAAYDVPRHLYHFSPASIKKLVEPFGFSLEKQLPMTFDAYYVSMLSEKYRGGSMLSALKTGWASNRAAGADRSSSQIYIFRKK
jgi:SAM-dependent methyltransferase